MVVVRQGGSVFLCNNIITVKLSHLSRRRPKISRVRSNSIVLRLYCILRNRKQIATLYRINGPERKEGGEYTGYLHALERQVPNQINMHL